MTKLNALNLVAFERPNNSDPKLKRRRKLLDKLNEQMRAMHNAQQYIQIQYRDSGSSPSLRDPLARTLTAILLAARMTLRFFVHSHRLLVLRCRACSAAIKWRPTSGLGIDSAPFSCPISRLRSSVR